MADASPTAIVATFSMAAGATFRHHTHDRHQLAWAAQGVLAVATDAANWVLPPTRALWIPAGLRHQTSASGPATMQTVYLHPERCPIDWDAPTPVAVSPLLAQLIIHLDGTGIDPAPRARAEAVLIDLLKPEPVNTLELCIPHDPRAREVAATLALQPADARTLAQWGRQVGASQRTLARAFLADTGVTFGRWRTRLRLQAALPTLADGGSVTHAAERAGYATPSAFIAAFHRETGITPSQYFRT